MKYLVIPFLLFSCCSTKNGRQAEPISTSTPVTGTVVPGTGAPATPTVTTNSDKIALYFGSMASGPIGDDFLKEWLVNFNRTEKAAITADKYSACGKEGEYIIVLYKNGFDNALETRFNTGLEALLKDEVAKKKTENPSSGSVEIRRNPMIEDYTYCRLGSKKWL